MEPPNDPIAAAGGHLSAGETHVLLTALGQYAHRASSQAGRRPDAAHQAATAVLRDLAAAAAALRNRIAEHALQDALTLTTSAEHSAAPHPLQVMHEAMTATEDQALWGALLDFEAAAGARADDGESAAAKYAELASDLIARLTLTSAGSGHAATAGDRS